MLCIFWPKIPLQRLLKKVEAYIARLLIPAQLRTCAGILCKKREENAIFCSTKNFSRIRNTYLQISRCGLRVRSPTPASVPHDMRALVCCIFIAWNGSNNKFPISLRIHNAGHALCTECAVLKKLPSLTNEISSLFYYVFLCCAFYLLGLSVFITEHCENAAQKCFIKKKAAFVLF
jgi:hypothetical protein